MVGLMGFGVPTPDVLTQKGVYSVGQLSDGTYVYISNGMRSGIKVCRLNFRAIDMEFFLKKKIPARVLVEMGMSPFEDRILVFEDCTEETQYISSHGDEYENDLLIRGRYNADSECADYRGRRVYQLARIWCTEKGIEYEDDEAVKGWWVKYPCKLKPLK